MGPSKDSNVNKAKVGRKTFERLRDKASSSLWPKHNDASSNLGLSGNQDRPRSLTSSLSNQQEDSHSATPIYAAEHYQIPEGDRLDHQFDEVLDLYQNSALPRTPPQALETRYTDGLSKPSPGFARNEVSDSSGRNALAPRSSGDINRNIHFNRRPAPGERQATSESFKRAAKQQQQGRPSSQDKVDIVSQAHPNPDAVVSHLQTLSGCHIINDATFAPTRSDSPRNGTQSPVQSVASGRDFQTSELATFFDTVPNDAGERPRNESEGGPQVQRGIISDDASVNERVTTTYDGLDSKRLRDLVYERFCANWDELLDEKKNKHQHRVARWVAKEAERLLREDVKEVSKEMDQKNLEMATMRAQLKQTTAENERLESANQQAIEAERERSAQTIQELRDSMGAEVQKQVREIKAKISQNHQAELDKKARDMEALEKQHRQAMSKKTEEIVKKDQSLREEINRKNDKISLREREIETKQRTIETDRSEYKRSLNEHIQASEDNRKKWQESFERVRVERAKQLQDLELTHADTIHQKDRAHEANIAELQEKLRTCAAEAEADKTDALLERDELHAEDRSSLIAKHEAETKTLRDHVDTIENEAEKIETGWKARLEDQKRTLTAENKAEIARLESEKQAAEKKHTADREQWQKQLREQQRALLSRDDEEYNLRNDSSGLSAFPAKPDETIQANFQEIQDLVDELSTMKWKPDQRMWTPQVFQRVGSNQVSRLLRKAILQDLVWTVLFHGIFCSPFRVFGAEGEALERQWAEQCGGNKDPYRDGPYSWPSPGIDTERWRYMTIRECNQVLRNPASRLDPRAKLKKEFKGSSDDLISRLKAVLGDIAEIEEDNVDTIQKLARRTAALWIDLEMHRCRIVVSLTGTPSKTTTEKVSLAQRGSFALTVTPSIGRYGNVEGLELDTFTVIDNCAGETLKIP